MIYCCAWKQPKPCSVGAVADNPAYSPAYQETLAQARAALGAADWRQAQALFEQALRLADTPAAHDGLGLALWWLNEIEPAHQQRTQAYLGYKAAGETQRAARLAAWLAREQVFLRGNTSAMSGWFARAESLLAGDHESLGRGWLELYRATMLEGAGALRQVARHSLELARRLNDPDLEAFALVNAGYAEISLGSVEAGMQNIDEAMVAATSGEVGDLFVISEIFCVTLSACELAGDLVRTQHWCEIAQSTAEKFRSPFLSAYCRTTLGGLLAETGQWEQAEAALTEAIRSFEAGHRALRFHAVIKLANLRLDQGRIEEARLLLEGQEDQGGALLPLARLHLVNGDPQAANALLEHALESPQPATLAQAPLLRLAVDVALALHDLPGARRQAQALAALARQSESDFMAAQAELALGQVARSAGEAGAEAGAQAHFQAALQHLQRYDSSLLAGRARLDLAYALQSADPHGAAMWARAALAGFKRLGARHAADEAASLLRALGIPGWAGGRQSEPLSAREAEVLDLLAHGLTNKQIGERLFISPKTAEHHVSAILDKLGLRSRAEAAAYAARYPGEAGE